MKTTHIKNLLNGRLYPATDFHFSTNQIDYVDPGTEYCEHFSLMNGEWEYVEQEIVVHDKTLQKLKEEGKQRRESLTRFREDYWLNEPTIEPKSDFLRHLILWNESSDSVEECIEKSLEEIKERVAQFESEYDDPEYLEIWADEVKQIKNLSKEQLDYLEKLLIFNKGYLAAKETFEQAHIVNIIFHN